MGNLMAKELRLALHPTAPLFLALSAMMIIPNYPYYVIFFYTAMAIFFICLTGRENHDVFFSMLLPVAKRDIVKARFTTAVILELLQMLLAIPFAAIRQQFSLPHNQVGLEANIALFGSAFIMLGIFHVIFFGIYYRDINKPGKAFVVSCVGIFIYMCIAEVLVNVVPYFRDCIDTMDNQYVGSKLVILAIGIVVYLILTIFAYKQAAMHFEKQDI